MRNGFWDFSIAHNYYLPGCDENRVFPDFFGLEKICAGASSDGRADADLGENIMERAKTRNPFFAGNPRKVDPGSRAPVDIVVVEKVGDGAGARVSLTRSRPSKSRAHVYRGITTTVMQCISALLLGYLTRTAIVPRDKRARVRSRVGVSRRRLPPSVRKIPFSCTTTCLPRRRPSVRTKFARCALV